MRLDYSTFFLFYFFCNSPFLWNSRREALCQVKRTELALLPRLWATRRGQLQSLKYSGLPECLVGKHSGLHSAGLRDTKSAMLCSILPIKARPFISMLTSHQMWAVSR